MRWSGTWPRRQHPGDLQCRQRRHPREARRTGPGAGHGGQQRPFRGNKFSAFDGGMHVPAIMSWPGVIPGGQVIHEIGSHVDLLPTIAKAAGASIPADRKLDGFDRCRSPLPGEVRPRCHLLVVDGANWRCGAANGNWCRMAGSTMASRTNPSKATTLYFFPTWKTIRESAGIAATTSPRWPMSSPRWPIAGWMM